MSPVMVVGVLSRWMLQRYGTYCDWEVLQFQNNPGSSFRVLGESWNYDAAWSYLRHIPDTGELSALATKHHIDPEDLILRKFSLVRRVKVTLISYSKLPTGATLCSPKSEPREDCCIISKILPQLKVNCMDIGPAPRRPASRCGVGFLKHQAPSGAGNILTEISRLNWTNGTSAAHPLCLSIAEHESVAMFSP
ncbi:hypothetical protein FB451DRAFT_460415 [Mycena latifolia]|nr:hypothetical protein FB451DRAFT_460415 [Mycena latifolia]